MVDFASTWWNFRKGSAINIAIQDFSYPIGMAPKTAGRPLHRIACAGYSLPVVFIDLFSYMKLTLDDPSRDHRFSVGNLEHIHTGRQFLQADQLTRSDAVERKYRRTLQRVHGHL